VAVAEPVDGTVKSADGVEIHYRTDGSGKTALLFIHGWSCDAGYWDAQIDHFAKTHRVVALDLGGHGKSGLGRKRWSMAAFGADVRAVVKKLDLDEVVLIGHSMGGPVMVEAALALPDRVIGLVGVDNFQMVPPPIGQEQIRALMGQMESDFQGFVEVWVRGMFVASSDPNLVDRVAEDMASAPPEVGIGAIGETLTWYVESAKESLGKLKIPLHCINADLNPTDAEGNAKLIKGYKLRVMKGMGHFPMMEDPATFNRLLEATLKELSAE
jgi:pimeloyl-ACP methyl ester carboxylesterase